jgi:Ala-tRNA(Pro) deacylase
MTIAAAVKSYIEGRGIAYDIISHYQTGSSHETAQAAHIDEAHMAKAVILQDSQGSVMVIVPGDAWVSLSAVQQALGREMELAVESDAAGHFPDCEVGAIPALGPAYGMETLLDESLVSLAFQYIESGDHRTLIKVNGRDFLTLLDGVRRGHFCNLD